MQRGTPNSNVLVLQIVYHDILKVPFDTSLIERNVELYFSGSVKPIYDDNPDPSGNWISVYTSFTLQP